jgi:transcriptional regulator with XRE-family HTH domain
VNGGVLRLDRTELIRARERLGWAIETVAEKARVSKNSVLRAEHGEDIRPLTARKIAAALGVTVADLYREIDSPKTPQPPLATALESEARQVLDRVRANRALLEHYMAEPPDEDTWDTALFEHYDLGPEPLRMVADLLDHGTSNQALLRELVDMTLRGLEMEPRLETFNEAQYGHMHRDAG